MKVVQPLKPTVPGFVELKEGYILEWNASRLGREHDRSITIDMEKLSANHAAVKLVCLPDIPVHADIVESQ